jgi:hypothetical protein
MLDLNKTDLLMKGRHTIILVWILVVVILGKNRDEREISKKKKKQNVKGILN